MQYNKIIHFEDVFQWNRWRLRFVIISKDPSGISLRWTYTSRERVVTRSWQSVRVSMASLTSKWIEPAWWHARLFMMNQTRPRSEREKEKERGRSFLRKLSPPTAHSTTRYHSGFKNLFLADSRRNVVSWTVREIYKSETFVDIRIANYLNSIDSYFFVDITIEELKEKKAKKWKSWKSFNYARGCNRELMFPIARWTLKLFYSRDYIDLFVLDTKNSELNNVARVKHESIWILWIILIWHIHFKYKTE